MNDLADAVKILVDDRVISLEQAQAIINPVIHASHTAAVVAIGTTEQTPGADQIFIDMAKEKLVKGLEHVENNEPKKPIEHFRNAIENAEIAMEILPQ